MSVALQVQILNIDGDEADKSAYALQKNDYDYWLSLSVALSAATKTEIKLPFSTVKLLYVEAVSEIKVYKNLSPEAWTVDGVFLASDTSISQLHLESTDAQTVKLVLGGS